MLDQLLNLIPIPAAETKQAPTRLLLLRDGDIGWAGLKGVELTPASAKTIIDHFEKQGAQLVIDYHHATNAVEIGDTDKAPAAGWIRRLEYVKGDGLYADDIEWTQDAAAEILAKQYKYLSPIIQTKKGDNEIVSLHSIALTNRPRTIDAQELLEAAQLLKEHQMAGTKKEKGQEEVTPAIDAETKMLADFVEALRAAGVTIDESATMTDILSAAIQFVNAAGGVETEEEMPPEEAEAKAKAEKEAADAAAAAEAEQNLKDKELASLTTRLKTAEEALAAIKAEKASAHVDELIKAEVDANKLNPNDPKALESARTLAEKDEAAFTKLFASIEPYGPATSKTKGAGGVGSTGREKIIAEACREYDDNPKQACGASKRYWVNECLAEQAEVVLSDAEFTKLEGVQA